MRYCLDIPSTATTMPFKSEVELMAEFNRTELECEAWHGTDCIAEAYYQEGEDGEIFLERVLHIEDAEYVML